MEKGNILGWSKQEGDELAEGEVLCQIETDKATIDFETPEEGYLAKIMFAEGSKDIPIGTVSLHFILTLTIVKIASVKIKRGEWSEWAVIDFLQNYIQMF